MAGMAGGGVGSVFGPIRRAERVGGVWSRIGEPGI